MNEENLSTEEAPFFRPWSEILGHKENIHRLRGLHKIGRLPHALLFYGAEGIGKLQVARMLAAEILCESDAGRPCGSCRQCKALLNGSHPDYYEVKPEGKAVKSICIDAIRKVQVEAARLPLLAKKRVIVIDDAEKMNETAQNSLLKTIEEPQGDVCFILVTRERSSLLDTIRSRCMNIGFGGIPREELAKALALRGIEKSEAVRLASLSDGSYGKALALREEGTEVRKNVIGFLKKLPSFLPEDVFQYGSDMEGLPRERLADWFLHFGMLVRDMLVLSEGGDESMLYNKDEAGVMAEILPSFPIQRIKALLALSSETNHRLQANVNQRLLLDGFFLKAMDA